MLVSAGSMGHEVTCRTASETHSCPDGEQTGVAGGQGGAAGRGRAGGTGHRTMCRKHVTGR